MTVPAAGSSRPQGNADLDRLIATLADLLAPAEDRLVHPGDDVKRPLVLVVGAPRSGTTLMTQWLASTGAFAVPTNLLARFSRTPAVAARIQMLLTDPKYAIRDELFDLAPAGAAGGFASDLGKTRGALAPAEFAFFWRRFLPTQEIRALGPEGVAASDVAGLRASLAAIESAFGKPLAMKGMFLQYDIADFAPLLPKAVFLHVRRGPVRNVTSLLEARERYHGDRRVWYSAKPRETESLLGLDPVRQVAGQVVHTVRAIRRGLAAVPTERWIDVPYERFCADPRSSWDALRAKLAALGDDPGPYTGPLNFAASRERVADAALDAEIRAALAELGEEA
ncbi:MAG: sulfotransferase [Planctomycetes bacterium]|nr:sulfotransferase [Planctomycetota bacterium]